MSIKHRRGRRMGAFHSCKFQWREFLFGELAIKDLLKKMDTGE